MTLVVIICNSGENRRGGLHTGLLWCLSVKTDVQRKQHNPENAESDRMKLIGEKQATNTLSKQKSRLRRSRDIQGSSTEEYRWLGYLWNQKELGKEISNEVDRRDEQQRQADERKVIPGSTYKALTEESYQEKVEAGITALNHTATRVPINTDKAIRNLMHACNRNAMQQISKVVHKEHGMAKVTICLCRECYTNFTGREEITVSQFRNMWDTTMKKHI